MNNNFEYLESGASPLSSGSNVRTKTQPQNIYTIYLDDEIGEPAEYREAMQVLEGAQENDVVYLSINSPGGRLDSGLMLINGIRSCAAPVIGQIHADCGSMATGVALACDSWQLGEFAYFFCHAASYGIFGKAQEVRGQSSFMEAYVDKFLKSMYSGFLSTKEIALVSRGEDLWIDRDNLVTRLRAYAEYRQKKEEREQRAQERQYKAMMKEMKNALAEGEA